MHAKLLVETADPSEFEYIIEEKNSKESPNIYIKGPYAMAEGVNKNKRSYCPKEMAGEVKRYLENTSLPTRRAHKAQSTRSVLMKTATQPTAIQSQCWGIS